MAGLVCSNSLICVRLFLFFSLNCEGVTPFICLNEVLKIARIRKTYFIGNLANAQIGIC